MNVLIADDDPDIREFISYNLREENINVITAKDGLEAITKIKEYNPDVVVLDIMMPGMDGVETCFEIRRRGYNDNIIIMLSARSENYTKLAAFDAGCNDYITKPIHPKIFTKKIKALNRIKENKTSKVDSINIGKYTVDFNSHTIKKEDKEYNISKKQFLIFSLLASNPGAVFSRKKIFKEVWGENIFVTERTVDVHINSIRKVLGYNCINTIKGVGYKIPLNV